MEQTSQQTSSSALNFSAENLLLLEDIWMSAAADVQRLQSVPRDDVKVQEHASLFLGQGQLSACSPACTPT
eukprot:1074236-Pelagomonas_calceolata.AAC.1